MNKRSEQKRAWNKANYDQILINVPKGKKELIKKTAEIQNKSVNKFICDLIFKEIF